MRDFNARTAFTSHIAERARRVILSILALLGLIAMAPVHADDVMRIHFIDVGQGDATLVELPCGSILIDAAAKSGPSEVVRATRARPIWSPT